ncbi:hypothetical protein Gpo141_00005553 [Globisporangium polare]
MHTDDVYSSLVTRRGVGVRNASLSVQATKECSKFTATSSAADVCGNAKCLDAIKKAVSQFEDCTVAGMDVKKTLEDAIASCPGSSTTSASASTSTKASIVTVAATSVLAVVAMRL